MPSSFHRAYEHTDFLCPISMDIMEDPWTTPWGTTFEKRAIEQWVDRARTCPITRKRLLKHQLKPNHALRAAIAESHTSSGAGALESSSAEWPHRAEQHVKLVVVNFTDESHLYSFAAHHQRESVIEALGGMSFDVLPAEVCALVSVSVRFLWLRLVSRAPASNNLP